MAVLNVPRTQAVALFFIFNVFHTGVFYKNELKKLKLPIG
jgi:hypothetical protein